MKKKVGRKLKLYEAFGEFRTLQEWCDKYGKNKNTVANRMTRGMTLEQALTTRLRPNALVCEYKGQTITVADLARLTGMSYGLLKNRVKVMGLSGDEAVSKPVQYGGYRGNHKKEKYASTYKESCGCGHDDCFTCPYPDCIVYK